MHPSRRRDEDGPYSTPSLYTDYGRASGGGGGDDDGGYRDYGRNDSFDRGGTPQRHASYGTQRGGTGPARAAENDPAYDRDYNRDREFDTNDHDRDWERGGMYNARDYDDSRGYDYGTPGDARSDDDRNYDEDSTRFEQMSQDSNMSRLSTPASSTAGQPKSSISVTNAAAPGAGIAAAGSGAVGSVGAVQRPSNDTTSLASRKLADVFKNRMAKTKGDHWKVIIIKATSREPVPPKGKHVKTIMFGIENGGTDVTSREGALGSIMHHLRKRLQERDWLVVLKTLVVFHYILREGRNPTFMHALCGTWSSVLNMNAFQDENPTGYIYANFIRSYGAYLVQLCHMKAQIDFPPITKTQVDSNDADAQASHPDQPPIPNVQQQEEARLIQQVSEYDLAKLLKALPLLESTIEKIFAIDTQTKTSNGATLMQTTVFVPAYKMALKDLTLFWGALDEGMLNLERQFFQIENPRQLKLGFDLYKYFAIDLYKKALQYFKLMKDAYSDWEQPYLEFIPNEMLYEMEEFVANPKPGGTPGANPLGPVPANRYVDRGGIEQNAFLGSRGQRGGFGVRESNQLDGGFGEAAGAAASMELGSEDPFADRARIQERGGIRKSDVALQDTFAEPDFDPFASSSNMYSASSRPGDALGDILGTPNAPTGVGRGARAHEGPKSGGPSLRSDAYGSNAGYDPFGTDSGMANQMNNMTMQQRQMTQQRQMMMQQQMQIRNQQMAQLQQMMLRNGMSPQQIQMVMRNPVALRQMQMQMQQQMYNRR